MHNWDKKTNPNEITVVYGDVPHFAIGEVLKDVMEGREYWETSTIRYTGADKEDIFEVSNDSGIAPDHLAEVLECLRDAIGKMGIEQYVSHQNDLLVHAKDNLWVDVAYGDFGGPSCLVHLYHVTI
jgi:hypothetical protein